MITSAIIQHYKSIDRAQLDFGPLNIIVGSNGAGKSNIIDALYFIHDCVEDDIDTAVTKRHGIDSIRQWSKSKPYHVTIQLTFKDEEEHGCYNLVLGSANGEYRIIEEFGEWYSSLPFQTESEEFTIGRTSFFRDKSGNIKIETDHKRAPVRKDTKISQSELFLSSLRGPMTINSMLFAGLIRQISSFISYSIYPNTIRQPQVISRLETLASDGSNLGTILKKMTGNTRSNKASIVESLRVIMPQMHDLNVRSVGSYYVPVIKVVESTGEKHDYDMSQVSDGTLRMLGLLTAFYQQFAPGIIAIEEPEQMIHPGVLEVISSAAQIFSQREGSQVFLTTHSPNLLDLFPAESIIWANQRNGITECGHIVQRQLDIIKKQLFTAGELLVAEGFFE